MISQKDWPSIKEGQIVYGVSLTSSYEIDAFVKMKVAKATAKQVSGSVSIYSSSTTKNLRSDYYLFDNYQDAAEFYCSNRLDKKIEGHKKEIQRLRDKQHQYLHKLKDLP